MFQKEKREKEAENIFEDIIAENFPNIGKETDVRKHRAPDMINSKRPTSRHIVCR